MRLEALRFVFGECRADQDLGPADGNVGLSMLSTLAVCETGTACT